MDTLDVGSNIHALQAARSEDAIGLVAIGTDHSLEVVIIVERTIKSIASFHIGSRVTSLTFSPRTVSPSFSDDWFIELAVASADFGLHLLTQSRNGDQEIYRFGAGLSGHHGRVNDITFCGGKGEDSIRYLATVGDDKMLMVWDLYPGPGIVDSSGVLGSSSPPPRLQPTAYVIAFPHPLTTVSAHPSSSKEFLVSDARGCLFLTDWRSNDEDEDWRMIELIEPHALSSMNPAIPGDNSDIIGAVYSSRYSLWDISRLQGGKPVTGPTFPQGGHRFRWCPTIPEHFAISTQSPSKGATVAVYTTARHAPQTISLAPRPHFVRDFDWLGNSIVAAIGRKLVVVEVRME
ncbi:WD40-repeat-containing domain protein [Roridomyces roridus]|uniref:WD40-repeat-containing domain protein n=1 Tax=Roridomyces roridus TaxID=1738132 RepID=A0AAD7BW70_9AGAR|nr:WD40-repeat-containing domain protein [Roridomyces roridus]